MSDTHWMRLALELAERGRGFVEPNPLVGALVVRNGVLVGEGWHQRYGEAHAEVQALNRAGDAATGATLYVTLEPCCHHGKTPPCTDAVLKAGITRVVAAMSDPFPEVSGRGAELLRAAGVKVELGVCEREARRLNAPYLTLLQFKRPYMHLKWAMTLDGKIATRTGNSKWISNEASRRRVHELRGRVDGIVVGIGTVLADDPLLTARPPGARIATRIILDRQARTPLDSQLVRTAREIPTLIATLESANAEAVAALQQCGCEVVRLPILATVWLGPLIEELGRRRMTNLLVEGGATVLGNCFDAELVDEVHVFVAPVLAGGLNAITAIAGEGVAEMRNGHRLRRHTVETIDGDVYIHGIAHDIGA